MNVVLYQPSEWDLLAKGKDLYLDVNCQSSIVSYCWVIKLNKDEVATYSQSGRSFIQSLSQRIAYSHPGTKGSSSEYTDRGASRVLSDTISSAIMKWKDDSNEDSAVKRRVLEVADLIEGSADLFHVRSGEHEGLLYQSDFIRKYLSEFNDSSEEFSLTIDVTSSSFRRSGRFGFIANLLYEAESLLKISLHNKRQQTNL